MGTCAAAGLLTASGASRNTPYKGFRTAAEAVTAQGSSMLPARSGDGGVAWQGHVKQRGGGLGHGQREESEEVVGWETVV